ncbi:lipid-binding SYLF domain-containing protein [Desulfogranum mediterraneum]|uniref:lipid-binding SYLF domain-containing protein n=1 Tax=Desulfogranum mediterraneum TaxID=160661 RepID=UPI00041FAEC2|nr:lipid-binding SYLF domain-containing protein [Desulfogranum mediterraneum]
MYRPYPSWKILLPLLLLLLSVVTPGRAGDFSKPQELVSQSEAVFKSFMADPNMEWFHHNIGRARGIFIVPQMLRGGFIIGGSGGSGVLLSQDLKSGAWSYPAFYTMGSVSLGLQIGADASEIILMVMTDKGLDAMLSTEFKLGADVAVAAGPIGRSAKAQTADILAFGRSKGAFGGLSIEGAIISPRNDWNQQYYDQPIRAVNILMDRKVTNPQADGLRQALPQARRRGKPLGS